MNERNTRIREIAMSIRTVTLPEMLYERLAAQAEAVDRSVDEVVLQNLLRTLPPEVEDDLPSNLQIELEAMALLSDDGLWQLAQSAMNADKMAFYDLLLERYAAGELTPEGQEMLTRLREEADALMLRKAHAYVLLQNRGHRLPPLTALRSPSS
jgi:hypothetical protein